MLHASHFLHGALLVSVAAFSLSPSAQAEQAASGEKAPVPQSFEQNTRIEPTVTLTDADAERTITLAEDAVVEVRLPADRENGYTWIPRRHLLPVLSAYGVPEYELDESAQESAPAIEVWRFMAEEAGTAELVFEYRKPLGNDEPAGKTLVFHLEVE